MKAPLLTPEQRRVMRAGRSGPLTLHPDNKMYAIGSRDAVCSGATMLKLCERGWWTAVRHDAGTGRTEYRMTGTGREIERAIQAKYGDD